MQYDLTLGNAIAPRCFYVCGERWSFHTAKTHMRHKAGLKSRSAAFSRVTVMCYRMGGSIGAGTNSLIAPGKPREEAPCST
jgi:hypothetical protein